MVLASKTGKKKWIIPDFGKIAAFRADAAGPERPRAAQARFPNPSPQPNNTRTAGPCILAAPALIPHLEIDENSGSLRCCCFRVFSFKKQKLSGKQSY